MKCLHMSSQVLGLDAPSDILTTDLLFTQILAIWAEVTLTSESNQYIYKL